MHISAAHGNPAHRATYSIVAVTDNLFAQGITTNDEIGVSFEPTNSVEIVNGEITFGGTDSSKFTGAINFAYVADPASCRVDSRGGVC